jgi:hypothetical protein
MNQKQNQHWPFTFSIGWPEDGDNAKKDFEAHEATQELLGCEKDRNGGGEPVQMVIYNWFTTTHLFSSSAFAMASIISWLFTPS